MSSTQAKECPPRPSKKGFVTTLLPEKLSSFDFLELSNRKLAQVTRSTSFDRVSYKIRESSRIPFPPGTQGSLYYKAREGYPALAGEVRFRLMESPPGASFEAGEDLQSPDGGPWHVPIANIVSSRKTYRGLADVLVADGILPSEDYVARLRGGSMLKSQQGSIVLYALDDIFTFALHVSCMRLTVVDAIGPSTSLIILQRLFCTMPLMPKKNRASIPRVAPLTGTISCKFERSTLPEHAGTPTLVLRVVDVLNPIATSRPDLLDQIPMPEKGELVHIFRKGTLRPWSYDIDTTTPFKTMQGLRLLFGDQERGVDSGGA